MGGASPSDVSANALFENPGNDHHWITLELRGVDSNRFGVGAKIAVTVVESSGERTIRAVVGSGGSFGASPLRPEIGLGDADKIKLVEVRWPSGVTQTFRDVPSDQFIRITENESSYKRLVRPSFRFGGVMATGATR